MAASIEMARIRTELGNGIANLLEPSARDGRIDPKVAAGQLTGVDAATFARWVQNSGDSASRVGAAYYGDSVPKTTAPAPAAVSDERIVSLIRTAKSGTWDQRDAVLSRFLNEHIDLLTPKQAAQLARATHYLGEADKMVLAYFDRHRAELQGDAEAIRTLRNAKSIFGMSTLYVSTVDRLAEGA